MEILREVEQLRKYRNSTPGKCAFVPTMGALHAGHLALVRQAKLEADFVIVSVFVNPTQFNRSEDLENYPRDERGDAAMLESVGCDAVWFPSVEDVYPNGAQSNSYNLGIMDEVMEGEFRPGHFQGVATVVDRLFRLVEPHMAFFGEKDYQQVAVIQSMVAECGHDVDVRVHDTVREKSGLAMSSRNRRLSPEQLQKATVIFEAMNWIRMNKDKGTPIELLDLMRTKVQEAGFDLEYLEIADERSLIPLKEWSDSKSPRIFAAASLGPVRLIDNLSLI